MWYVLTESGALRHEPDVGKWLAWRVEEGEKHHLHHTSGRFYVSTVFLGLDHRWDREQRRPIVWETMVFQTPSHGWREVTALRYCTREAAERGHHAHVRIARLARVLGWRLAYALSRKPVSDVE